MHNEDYENVLDGDILNVLLKDRTTGKNIIWATDNYGFSPGEEIKIENLPLIKPRLEKSKEEQQKRTKGKAEVFTPSWICNDMNNNLTEEWFGRKNVFNVSTGRGWKTNNEKISFPCVEGKNWLDYVRSTVLEITCGEGPFLVSRYDTVTGEYIDPFDRIGLLDRKIRVVNENIDFGSDGWFEIILEAYKATYGYEFQGDNLFLARKNLLLTFIDNYQLRINKYVDKEKLLQVAEIISWNLWQMDGLKYVIPNSCKTTNQGQISLFTSDSEKECPGCKENNILKHTGIYCKIKDWKTNSVGRFVDIVKK
nr:MAG TPA: putative RNA methylase [Caudoviricetes sp.]